MCLVLWKMVVFVFFPLVQGACNKLNTPCGLGDTSSNRISAQIAFFARVTLYQWYFCCTSGVAWVLCARGHNALLAPGGGGWCCRLVARGVGGWGRVVVLSACGPGAGGLSASGPGGGGGYLVEKREREEPYIIWTGYNCPRYLPMRLWVLVDAIINYLLSISAPPQPCARGHMSPPAPPLANTTVLHIPVRERDTI